MINLYVYKNIYIFYDMHKKCLYNFLSLLRFQCMIYDDELYPMARLYCESNLSLSNVIFIVLEVDNKKSRLLESC